MDVQLDAQFQRVETALQKLIDSITTYNPSVPAAEQLLLANEGLTESLKTLATHQANHARILFLRQTASNLDDQVKDGVRSLAEARKQLTSSSLAGPPDNSRDVPFDELIAYAQRISRWTVPPTYRAPLPLPLTRKERVVPVLTDGQTKQVNGTPATNTPAAADGIDEAKTSPVWQAAPEQDRGTAWQHLNPAQQNWLESINQMQYVPWPPDNDVKSGALARIQAMKDQGIDPAAGDYLKTRAQLEEEKSAAEERARKELEELHERQRRGSRTGQRPVMQGGGGAGLDLYDPDEE